MPDFINLPTKEQLDTQNAILATIASNLNPDGLSISSWEDVQRIVRMGVAHKFFTVGDSFVATYAGVEYIWDIIGINHDEPVDPRFQNSITIQARDCLMNCTFDAVEPTNPDSNRQQYGSNNYLQSNIRQWLNSEDAVFNFIPQTEYDTVPSTAPYNGAGFLYNLDSELKAVIGPVKKQVAKNTNADGGGQDLFEDKVFLLSTVEVYGEAEGEIAGENPYEYYSLIAPATTTGELPGRIKYLSGSSRHWMLRSPHVVNSHLPRGVSTAGSISNGYANAAHGLTPACTIY